VLDNVLDSNLDFPHSIDGNLAAEEGYYKNPGEKRIVTHNLQNVKTSRGTVIKGKLTGEATKPRRH